MADFVAIVAAELGVIYREYAAADFYRSSLQLEGRL
jgi:hypothetical protein